MKYIMFKAANGAMHPVIFPDDLSHVDVHVFGQMPISAGFVNTLNGQPFGKSVSLKLEANEADETRIFAALTDNRTMMLALNSVVMYPSCEL